MGRWRKHIYEGVAKTFDIDLKNAWKDLPDAHRELLLNGGGDAHVVWEWKQRNGSVWKHGGVWEGIVPQLLAQFKKQPPGRGECSSKSTCESSAAPPARANG
jgi:excinuclease ABC subunit A